MKYLTSFLAQPSLAEFTLQGTDRADKSLCVPTCAEESETQNTDKAYRSQAAKVDPSAADLPGIDIAAPTTTARQSLPHDGPGSRWAYDWRGVPVNLFGLRPGEDGRPPIFLSPKPEGLQ
jgi:hypothetical protein